MNIGSYDDSDDSDDDESPREKNQVTSSGLTDFCVRNIKERVEKKFLKKFLKMLEHL